MKQPMYPFSAIVGQDEMKLALLLAAVDWRLSVLLRGDKGAGKTTAARGLAALLPSPSPFVNLPIGATEDRLLGGLHLERALKGDPALKPGLLSEAHGGVLYVDEINLLAPHLGDALLDTSSSGVNIVEREGFSASHAAEFVLLGSMNPEEGSLRPQLLDRFALAVNVAASMEPALRQAVVERRVAFEQHATDFHLEWAQMEEQLRGQIIEARSRRADVVCSKDLFALISEEICAAGVRSLRADLAVVRASIAYAALLGDATVRQDHVAMVLPLAIAHRKPASRPHHPTSKREESAPTTPSNSEGQPSAGEALARVFAPRRVDTFALRPAFSDAAAHGASANGQLTRPGPVIGARRNESPAELDVRATLNHALRTTGNIQPTIENLHERVRSPRSGTRYLFVIDSSGSHAGQERMRLVKGAAESLLTRSFRNGDEVAIIAFRGTSAQVLLEPAMTIDEAAIALEYLPTGGRTPLAHALELAQAYITNSTVMILLTDGRANVAMGAGDPWQEALDIASRMTTAALVIDTENAAERLGRPLQLAEALNAGYVHLDSAELNHAGIHVLAGAVGRSA